MKRRTLLALAPGLLAFAFPEEGAREVWAAGCHLRWNTLDGVIHGVLKGPGQGWVCVGFNIRGELAGSLLVLAALTPDGLRVEEHIAQPPKHPERSSLGGKPGLEMASGSQDETGTTLEFRLKLVDDGLAPSLVPGEEVHLTLAWSREDDFDHHSAEREMVKVIL
jgi:hypothetical protein